MSAVADIIAALVDGGMDVVEAAALVARAGAEMSASGPSKAALRTRKWRASKASQSVTRDGAEQHETGDAESVTDRHRPSQSVTGDNSPLSIESKKEEKKEKREAKRGHRLSHDWTPTVEDWSHAVQLLGSEQRAQSELARFRDYWPAQPGARGLKLDWNGTWRNWCRRAADYRGGQNGNRTANPRTTGHDAILAAATRKAREIAGDGAMAGSADAFEFSQRARNDDRRADGFAGPDAGTRAGDQQRQSRSGPVLEGEVVARHEAAAGVSGGGRLL